MNQVLHLPQAYRPRFAGLVPAIRALAHVLASEHTRALTAASKAALPRRNAAELRALYVRPLDPRQ